MFCFHKLNCITTVYKYFVIQTTGLNTIIPMSNGNPFLAQLSSGEGNIFIFNSYFDENWSNIYYKGLFIPMLVRVFYNAAFIGTQKEPGFKIGDEGLVTYTDYELQKDFFLIKL